ncbi:MAG: hypothetical protein L0Y71_14855 [Gemmataceae bacterium]|nr:hypothetical protein [Gemmataceae bacterium]
MWNDQKRQRFEEMRQPSRQLDAVEQAELASLLQELETAESAYLQPATERLRLRNELTETQNRELERLIQRKEALALRVNQVLTEARIERQAIDNDVATVLAAREGSNTD